MYKIGLCNNYFESMVLLPAFQGLLFSQAHHHLLDLPSYLLDPAHTECIVDHDHDNQTVRS